MVELNQESSDKDPHLKYRREEKGWDRWRSHLFSFSFIFHIFLHRIQSYIA